MLAVAIYIKDVQTGLFNRVDLFDDEKISVVSSIQNINDISKTFTDFSQTFTVPASKQNNKIFRHWYDNTNDEPFSTLVKADAYIEIDTITFRRGKIQLESANVEDGQAKDYSITFIGLLGNLKDTFAGLYLKDLTSTTYDFNYTPNTVIGAVVDDQPSGDVMFPLISSKRNWNYGSITDSTNNINNATDPIRYNELFPALRLRAVLNMIEQRFGINFDGTTAEPSTFLSDARFTNAYLYLKNADTFEFKATSSIITFENISAITTSGTNPTNCFLNPPLVNNEIYTVLTRPTSTFASGVLTITPTVENIIYTINFRKKDGYLIYTSKQTSIVGNQTFNLTMNYYNNSYYLEIIPEQDLTFNASILLTSRNAPPGEFMSFVYQTLSKSSNQTVTIPNLSIKDYMPEIKIEDFFSGLLKMFNLTCYSTDGINYTVEQLESYYGAGSDVDITKYVIQDKKTLNRVKTHKKINFDYEKSESRINVAFESNAGIPYGSLHYSNNPPAEGEEYSIKLPFENLNFQNLLPSSLFQVGYALKTDLSSYIPKPIILYDYDPSGTTSAGLTFYTSGALSGIGDARTAYKAFGQETLGTITYTLNFNEQQSTLTNQIENNGLYQTYYSNYFANIFNFKARLTKISAILPTSILTSLKLNDTILIRDAKYLINTMTTDLTSGVAQFELLTDQREVEPAPSTDVLIGTQLWTNRNLDVETYRDGTPIPQVTDPTAWAALTTGAWCHYANNTANGVIYGKLYNWYAVAGIDGSGIPRILAPLGYHVPTDAEWTTLTTYLGGESVAGGKMKSTGTSLWQSPNTGATNESGFTGFPGGIRGNNGSFSYISTYGFWWSYSGFDTLNAWYRVLPYNYGYAYRDKYFKFYGFSVRLIKD